MSLLLENLGKNKPITLLVVHVCCVLLCICKSRLCYWSEIRCGVCESLVGTVYCNSGKTTDITSMWCLYLRFIVYYIIVTDSCNFVCL
jgi:hypothetical protein